MQNAKCWNFTAFWMSACVPTSIAISPLATHFKSCAREISVALPFDTFDGNFLQPLPVISAILIGRCEKNSMKDWKCCCAKISVGAMYATCNVPLCRFGGREFTTAWAEVAATSVLPLPTSPSSNLAIGCGLEKLSKMSLIARFCAEVGENGMVERNRSA